jgi:hypothetical protein
VTCPDARASRLTCTYALIVARGFAWWLVALRHACATPRPPVARWAMSEGGPIDVLGVVLGGARGARFTPIAGVPRPPARPADPRPQSDRGLPAPVVQHHARQRMTLNLHAMGMTNTNHNPSTKQLDMGEDEQRPVADRR